MQLNVIRADDSITHLALLGRLDIQGVNQIQEQFVFNTTSRRPAGLQRSTSWPSSRTARWGGSGSSSCASWWARSATSAAAGATACMCASDPGS